MKSKRKKLLARIKRYNRGGSDIHIIILVLLLVGFAFAMSGGKIMPKFNNNSGEPLVMITPVAGESRDSLQLRNLTGATTTPGITVPPQPSCNTTVSDTVIVIDNSGSMEGSALEKTKDAAEFFVDTVAVNNTSRVGLVKFSENSEILSGLTTDYPFLKTKINQIPESSGSCVQCGLKSGNQTIQSSLRDGVKRSVILLSDGRANHIDGKDADKPQAANAAKAEAMAGYSSNGTVFYTIGFGDDINTSLMQGIATDTGGEYFLTPSENQLIDAFARIAQKICQ